MVLITLADLSVLQGLPSVADLMHLAAISPYASMPVNVSMVPSLRLHSHVLLFMFSDSVFSLNLLYGLCLGEGGGGTCQASHRAVGS
jgi:hypothetical protein